MRAWCIGPTLRKSGSPQTAHSRRAITPFLAAIAGSCGDQLEHGEVDRLGRGPKQRIVAAPFEAGDQRPDVGEVEIGIAPVDEVERPEAMLLDRRDFLVAERGAAVASKSERSKAAVALVTARAPGDLRHFGDGQPAVAAAVELVESGEGDMGDVHVEAHADGIRGDQIIDLAALEHGNLRVARGGRQGAHDDCRAASEAAEHLGERVDLLGGEGDDRRPRRQARQLDVAGIAQGREARPADDLRFGQKLADDRLADVSEPRISVSSRPRARSIRSVKTWPRSGSMPSCASSIAAKAN